MYAKLTKQELITKCKEQGLAVGLSSKTKAELIDLLATSANNQSMPSDNIPISGYQSVLAELLKNVPRDKVRKVCKQCHGLGHAVTSVNCPVNKHEANIRLCKARNYMLSQDCLQNKTAEDYYQELAQSLNITTNQAKNVYSELTPDELLTRPMNIRAYYDLLTDIKCNECSARLYDIQINTVRTWKSAYLCDSCWCSPEKVAERETMWSDVTKYKPVVCAICSMERTVGREERFHYDHVNMFDKGENICSMVNTGVGLDTIQAELDKCQVLCLACHHLVTDIEHKIGFTRIKQNMTRQLNTGEITQLEYDSLVSKYHIVYRDKMELIYAELREIKTGC